MMAYIVMAYIVMAYIVMACIVIAYVVMALLQVGAASAAALVLVMVGAFVYWRSKGHDDSGCSCMSRSDEQVCADIQAIAT